MGFHRTVSWLVAVALACALSAVRVWAQQPCPAPPIDPPICDDRGRISISWPIDGCQPDTLKAHTGPFSHGYLPAAGYPVQAVAIRLDSLSAGTRVGALRAFFFGAAEATAAQWEALAGFVWSLNYDSTGYPGSPVSGLRYWPLGDQPLLRAGGWYEEDLGWEVTSPTSASYWLVGRWPEGAVDVVRIGSDGAAAPYPEVVGAGETDIAFWVPIYQPGLLVEVELQTTMSDTLRHVEVLRDWMLNPLARPSTPTAALDYCLGRFVDSAVAWPEEVRYGFVTVCEAVESETVWTAPTQVAPAWTVHVAPESLVTVMTPLDRQSVRLTLENPLPESITATVAEWWITGEGSECSRLTISGDTIELASGAEAEVMVELATSGCATGVYRGALILALRGQPDTVGFRFGVPIQVVVDQQTTVSSPDSVEGRLTPTDWRLRAGPNPFRETVNLHFRWDRPLIVGVSGPSIGSVRQFAPSAEVAVYNVLGQLIRRERHALDPGAAASGGETTIRLTGMSTWPSGVYICRVDLAGRTESMVLLHIR